MRPTCMIAGVILGLLTVTPSGAQFVQYTPSGDFVSPAEAREKALERAMERSRWRLGRLLLDPWIYIRNLRYEENQTSGEGQPVSDLTLGIGAGVNTYMALGGDFVWGTFLLPEYTWWQELDERRRLNGRYGTGLFGNLGRIGVEATVTRFDQSVIFSREVEENVSQRVDQGRLEVTLDLGKGFLLFGEVEARQLSSIEDDRSLEVLRVLDRDETIARGGIGYRSDRGIKLGIGFEESEADFEPAAVDRSNSGTSIVFDFEYDGPLFLLAGEVADRSIDPDIGSAFVPYDDFTGALHLGLRPFGPARLELFARKDVSYSIQEAVSYAETESAGVALRLSLGSRGDLRVFTEEGDDTYIQIEPGDPRRIDQRTSYGLDLSIQFDRFTWSLGGSIEEYDSNLPGLDREYTRFGTSISVGGRRSSPWG